jgi:phage protein D
VEATAVLHKELVQYDVSDWDFLLARAEVNELVVLAEAGKLTVKTPATVAAAQLSVAYGVDLIDFDADLDEASYTMQTAVPLDAGRRGRAARADRRGVRSADRRRDQARPGSRPAVQDEEAAHAIRAIMADKARPHAAALRPHHRQRHLDPIKGAIVMIN